MPHEAMVRLGAFVGGLLVVVFWEWLVPRRRLTQPVVRRWGRNLGLVLLNSLLARLLLPAGVVGMAALAMERQWGLLNQLDPPPWLALVVAVAALDLVIYLQHVMFHAVPVLWRLHMVHHADLDYDATTGLRFHPLEILLSLGIKLAAVLVIGPPPQAVLLFEVLLNATALFNHGNLRLPPLVDRFLRWVVVTPDMHRVHHSVDAAESNSNFGFNLPWWDRLLGTYLAQPALGHTGMIIGLEHLRDPERLTFGKLLRLPFVGQVGSYPLNRRWSDAPTGTGGGEGNRVGGGAQRGGQSPASGGGRGKYAAPVADGSGPVPPHSPPLGGGGRDAGGRSPPASGRGPGRAPARGRRR